MLENSVLGIKKVGSMKKVILSIALSLFALSSQAAVTVTDNPFYSDVEDGCILVDHIRRDGDRRGLSAP